jgi:hypothetical protein
MDMNEPPAVAPAPGRYSAIAIIRDVAILWGLTFARGLIIGILRIGGADPTARMVVIGLSNLLFAIIGFTISGCLTGGNRWRHLFIVAVIVWLSSLVNLVFGIHLAQWIIALPMTLIMMGIGGAISYAIRR